MSLGKEILNAIQNKDIDLLKKILSNNTDLNFYDSEHTDTPLHEAVKTGSPEIVKILLEKNSHVDANNNFNNTPLHIAATLNYITIAKLLIDNGANLSARNRNNKRPIDIAQELGFPELTQFLLDEECKK